MSFLEMQPLFCGRIGGRVFFYFSAFVMVYGGIFCYYDGGTALACIFEGSLLEQRPTPFLLFRGFICGTFPPEMQ